MNRKTRKTPQIPTRTRPRSARDVPPSAAAVKARPYAASKSGDPAYWAPKRSFVAHSFGTRSTSRGASTRRERAIITKLITDLATLNDTYALLEVPNNPACVVLRRDAMAISMKDFALRLASQIVMLGLGRQ